MPRALLLALLLLLAGAAPARAAALLPPAGRLFAGTTGGPTVEPFAEQTGHHPAVFQLFSSWGDDLSWPAERAGDARARLMAHLSTRAPDGRELTTPGAIASGAQDLYLLALNGALAARGQRVYLRLMSEMDNWRNPYAAFDADGRRRDAAHAPRAFRAAWPRTVIVLRGGPRATVNARLRAAHLAPLPDGVGDLPQPPVAVMWVPMTGGSPDVPANGPRAFWPGAAYVDWVGTDFYARFPNFARLERFYRAYPGTPFVFGEWALWGRDDPVFVHRLFGWIAHHRRVRIAMYNQGEREQSPFRLARYPRAAAALRARLAAPWVAEWAPEWVGA